MKDDMALIYSNVNRKQSDKLWDIGKWKIHCSLIKIQYDTDSNTISDSFHLNFNVSFKPTVSIFTIILFQQLFYSPTKIVWNIETNTLEITFNLNILF